MARPETLGAVLFDFDGTLCDTERHNLALVREVLVELDAPVSDEELLSIAGGDDRVVIPPILERYGSPYDIEEYERRRDGCYRTYSQAPLALEPGARELVSSLRGRGVAVALVSTTVARCVLTALDRLRALDLFDVVVTGDMVERRGRGGGRGGGGLAGGDSLGARRRAPRHRLLGLLARAGPLRR